MSTRTRSVTDNPDSVRPAPDSRLHDKPKPLVMLVEDNELVARSLNRLLILSDYQTVVFTSGSPAIDYAQSHPAPSAAVVDIHLPDLSGLVLIRNLRDRFGPDVPIIVCSGDTSMSTLNSLRHVGATFFLSKPVKGSQLIDQMKKWIGL
jgi:CheY-like chemotaxis protein